MPNSVSFYGASRGPIGGRAADYALDPRRQMALELMRTGSSVAPVQSWGEGLARALQAGVGGYFAREARNEQDQRDRTYSQDMAKVLAGGNAKPWVNPDTGSQTIPQEGTGKMVPTGPAGGLEGMAAALAGTNNADLAPFGQQIAMQQVASDEAARRAAQADQLARARAQWEWQNKPQELAPGATVRNPANGTTYTAPKSPDYGKDTPYPQGVQDQLVQIAAARAAAQGQAQVDAEAAKAANRPVPGTILKLEQDVRDALNTSDVITGNLDKYIGQIDTGKLDLGLLSNAEGALRNYVGQSTEQSANLASFKSGLEKLRNDSLRLNAGVQTDGDAQRAWNELMSNINDPKVVRQRLGEIRELNKKAAILKQQDLDQIHEQYPKLRPKDKPAANAETTAAPSMSAEDKAALDWANANPTDQRAAAIKLRLGAK